MWGFVIYCPHCAKRVLVAYSHLHGGHIVGSEAFRVLRKNDDVAEYDIGEDYAPLRYHPPEKPVETPEQARKSWLTSRLMAARRTLSNCRKKWAREKAERQRQAEFALKNQIRAKRRALIEAVEAETNLNASRWAGPRLSQERVWQPIEGLRIYQTSRHSLLREMRNYQGHNDRLNGTL